MEITSKKNERERRLPALGLTIRSSVLAMGSAHLAIFEKPVKIVERSIPYPEIYCNSFGARRDRNPHRKIREKRDFDRGGFPPGRGSICRGCGMPGQQAARRLRGGRRGPGERDYTKNWKGTESPAASAAGLSCFVDAGTGKAACTAPVTGISGGFISRRRSRPWRQGRSGW